VLAESRPYKDEAGLPSGSLYVLHAMRSLQARCSKVLTACDLHSKVSLVEFQSQSLLFL